jgi:mono/diheme cytochrome c family protein
LLCLLFGLAPTAARGDAPPPPSFARDVAPVLARWCASCHGPRHQQGGLRLDSYAAALGGGDSGPAIVAGDPDQSLLVAKIERRDRPAMPPRRTLPKAAVAALRAWIAAGALP